MAIAQTRSFRKVSGGRYRKCRKKKAYELGSQPTFPKLGKLKKKKSKVLAGKFKTRILATDTVNAYNPKTKKYEKLTIKNVIENPANRHFVRRNIITKGTIVETDKGKARITSRPGQEGTLNAIMIE